jgi:hypothetical protein
LLKDSVVTPVSDSLDLAQGKKLTRLNAGNVMACINQRILASLVEENGQHNKAELNDEYKLIFII